jgi:membrane protein implicated in regulation of membrane protease activity
VLLSAAVALAVSPFDPRVVVTGAVGCVLLAAEVLRRVASRADGLRGERGVVLVGGRDGGRVRVRAGDWRARWRGPLRSGATVRVVAVRGGSLEVEAAEP